MAEKIDVYRQWLGIPETERPLNHYQLLRLKRFEDDTALIRSHYRKLNAHVRKYATGDYARESQALLNELAQAMLCLTDATRKGEYDASLGRPDAHGARTQTVEELLVRRQVCDREQLERARRFADAVGLDIGDAVVQQKIAKPEVVMQIVAESIGLPYVELADIGVDGSLVPMVSAMLARQHSFVPLLVADGRLILASPRPLNPTVEEELRLRLNMPVRSVLCTAAAVNAAIQQHYPQEKAAAELAATSSASAYGAARGSSAGPSPDAKRRNLMMTLMAFNFTFMAVMLYLTLFRRPPSTFFSAAIRAVPSGALAALATFIVTRFLAR